MRLTSTFVKNVKHSGVPSGDKYRDGAGMYLLVNSSGKYWRLDYRFANKDVPSTSPLRSSPNLKLIDI